MNKKVKITLVIGSLIIFIFGLFLIYWVKIGSLQSHRRKLYNYGLAQFRNEKRLQELENNLCEITGIDDIQISESNIICPDYFYNKYVRKLKIWIDVKVYSDEIQNYISDYDILFTKMKAATDKCWGTKTFIYNYGRWKIILVVNATSYPLRIQSANNNFVEFDGNNICDNLWVNGSLVVHNVKEKVEPVGTQTGQSKPANSGSSSSHKNHSKRDSYDEGYEDIMFDDDYDWDRYWWDDDYASGVDDAMEDFDW